MVGIGLENGLKGLLGLAFETAIVHIGQPQVEAGGRPVRSLGHHRFPGRNRIRRILVLVLVHQGRCLVKFPHQFGESFRRGGGLHRRRLRVLCGNGHP